MNLIIFSKDRAMQLDLLIRSIKQNIPFGKIIVLYATSSLFSQRGYDLIKNRYHDVNLVWQLPFKKTLINTIKDSGRWIVMMVDDSVVINKVSRKELSEMFSLIADNNKIKCGSLVMGRSIDYCYPHDMYMEVPINNENIWNWTKEEKHTDWGYPHQVGGNLWEKDYLLKQLRWKRFNHPTVMESKLNWPYRKRRPSTPLMVCFDEIKVLTIPVNYIPKSTNENRNSGKYSLGALNELYLDGYRISTENIYNTATNAICKEIDFSFERC